MSTNNEQVKETATTESKSLMTLVSKFLVAFKKFWYIAIILMIIGGLFGFFRYKKTYMPQYTSKATISIQGVKHSSIGQVYTNSKQVAENLSVGFNYIINNEVFYEILERKLNVPSVPGIIVIENLEGTNIIQMSVTSADPDMARKVLNCVMDNYGSVAEFMVGDTKLTVLERPTVPSEPDNPYNPIKSILIFAFLAFVVGLIPSIIHALFMKTIRTRGDVERELNSRCFGILPAVFLNNNEKKRKRKRNELKELNQNVSILNKDVGFRYVEEMRSITSRCERKFTEDRIKVVVVTSTKAQEGKSTFATNLAISLSKTQKRVMLIDGDLRKPDIRNMVDIKAPDFSMGDFTTGNVKSSEAIVNLEATRLLVLAPNKPTINPVECINSDVMGSFIKEARDVVDYIVIDTPPIQGISDAAAFAKYSDGVLLVIKEDYVTVNRIINTLQEFSYTKKPIVGCIINGRLGRLGASYGYGSHYGYGKYGYGRYGYEYGYGYGQKHYGNYGEYGKVSDKEFQSKSQNVSKHISMKTTKEQKEALEKEKIEEEKKTSDKNAE